MPLLSSAEAVCIGSMRLKCRAGRGCAAFLRGSGRRTASAMPVTSSERGERPGELRWHSTEWECRMQPRRPRQSVQSRRPGLEGDHLVIGREGFCCSF
jgi:hypothetical protein